MKYLILIFCIVTFFISCKKSENITEIPIPTEVAKYGVNSTTAITNKAYFITSTATTGFTIPVSITTISNASRTVSLTYQSPTGAVNGTHYIAPTSVTIPANATEVMLEIKGVFAAYPTGRRDSLNVQIVDGAVKAATYYNKLSLILQKYCDVTLTALSGAYNNTREYNAAGAFQYGPYSTSVLNLVSASATTATCQLTNLYDDGWPAINATFDWTNPAAFKVTIPAQATGRTYSGLPASVRTSTAAGALSTFSSCDNSITTSIDIFSGTTLIASNYVIVLKR